jgi:hypothetical protein
VAIHQDAEICKVFKDSEAGKLRLQGHFCVVNSVEMHRQRNRSFDPNSDEGAELRRESTCRRSRPPVGPFLRSKTRSKAG